MKKLIVCLIIAIAVSGCVSHTESPGRIEQVTLPDGRIVDMYVFGYSIEDFKCEFERGEPCR